MTNIKKIKRNDWYYGKYQYSFVLHFPGSFYLKSLNHDAIDQLIRHYSHWITSGHLSSHDIVYIHDYCDLLLSLSSEFKIVIYKDSLYVYTSDIRDINCLVNSPLTKIQKPCQITEAELFYDKDFVYLKNPTHKFRSYLRSRELTTQNSEYLSNFFRTNQETVKPNPRLWYKLIYNNRYYYIHTKDFVDHNSKHEILMLNIMLPGIVRRTQEIKAK